MSPNIIEGDVFKKRKELPQEIFKDLIADGGAEKVKALLTEKWKYSPSEITAVPSLTVSTEGRLSGAKWHVLGRLPKGIILADFVYRRLFDDYRMGDR